MNRRPDSDGNDNHRPAFGTQLPGSFADGPAERFTTPGDSAPVASSAHGTMAAPVIESTAQPPATPPGNHITRTYAPGDSHVEQIVQHARTQQRTEQNPEPEGFTQTLPASAPPISPSVDKSTWNLRIRKRGVAGHISGIINEIPADASQATGLLSALASNDALPEYEVIDELAAGSMGVVYRARQTSLNRDLAIKTLKPGLTNPEYDQAMFVSEAVVTAHLVHPNIVPIHDLGRTADGKLFYSMKQVTGTPWHHRIRDMDLEPNLDIFLKVCDGVAFAHSRGVINRDLKPENVIIGDYGEVVVLDWGLALTTNGFARRDSVMLDFRGGGGTPVYMAPELAETDVSNVGIHTDIYLLGAILFEILEGRGPHWLRQIEQLTNPEEQFAAVIQAVVHNEIEPLVANEGELMQIARKAMSTYPMDRYETVEDLQEAIREYRVTGRAEELMRAAESSDNNSYAEYQGAVALYDEALRKWPNNRRAQDGDRKARKAYAELALKKGDVDLGLEVLPERSDRDFEPVRKKLKSTRRNRGIMRATWALATVGAAVAAFFATTYYLEAETQRRDAVSAKEEADQQRGEADKQRKDAVAAKVEADKQKTDAVAAKLEADEQRREAINAKIEVEKSAGTIEQLKKQEEALTQKADAAKKAERDANAAKAIAIAEKADAERKARDKIEEIALAKSEVEAAQKQAYQAFLDQIDAKAEIRKFDDAISLIDAELSKADSSEIDDRKRKELQRNRKRLEQRKGNAAFDVSLRLGNGIFSSDGGTLVTKATQVLTVFRNVDSVKPAAENGHKLKLTESAKQLAVSADGSVICAVGKNSKLAWKWDGQTYEPLNLPQNLESTIGEPRPLLSTDGQHLYLVGSNRTTSLIETYVIQGRTATLASQADLSEFNRNKLKLQNAILLPDESGIVALTESYENLRFVGLKWQGTNVQVRVQKQGEAENKAYPALKIGDAVPGKSKFLRISPDGSHLAVVGDNQALILNRNSVSATAEFPFSLGSGKPVAATYDGAFRDVKFSADNSRLMVAQKRYIWLWDKIDDAWKISNIDGLYDGRCLAGHSDVITVAGFLKDSNTRLLSCSEDNIIRWWDTDTYAEYVAAIHETTLAAKRPAGVQNQRTTIATLDSRPPYLLTVAQQTQQRPLRFQQGRRIHSAEFSQDSQRVLIGADDLAAHAFRTTDGKQILEASMLLNPRDPFYAPERNNFIEGHIPEIVSLQFLPPNGELLLTFDYFGSLSVWDAKDDDDGIGFEKSRLLPNNPVDFSDSEDGRSVIKPYEVEDPSCEIAVSQNGKWLIAGVVRNDGAVNIEDSKDEYFAAIWKTEDILETGQAKPHKELKGVYQHQITAASISPDSKTAITATRRGSFVLWDIEAKEVLATFDGAHNADGVSGVFFVSNSEFVSSGFDGVVLRWTVQGDKLIPTPIKRPEREKAEDSQPKKPVNPDFIIRLRPSPDGTRFVTADLNRDRKSKNYRLTLSHWSAKDGWQSLPVGISATLEDIGKPYRHDVSWSEDGQEILFVHDGKLVLIDAATLKRKEAFQLPAGNQAVRGAIAPKGPGGICIATFDGRRAQMWNLTEGTHIADFRSHGPVVRAGFSADQKFVVTGSDSIRVFNGDEDSPDHGLPVFRLPRKVAGPRLIEQVEFSPVENDDRFASVDTAGNVRIWDWSRGQNPPTSPMFDSGPTSHPGEEWMSSEEVAVTSRLSWSPDGTMLAVTQRGQIRIWSIDGNNVTQIATPLPDGIAAENVVLNAVDFSQDNQRVAFGGVIFTEDEEVESWGIEYRIEAAQAVAIAILNAERHSSAKQRYADDSTPEIRGITSIVLNDLADTIVTGGADSSLLTWFAPDPDASEAATIRPSVGEMELSGGVAGNDSDPHSAPISALDVAEDGRLVSADEAGWIVIWPPER